MFARMLLASLRARRARLGLGLLAVGLGVAVAIALGQLSLQVGDDLARTLRAAGPNFLVLPEGARLPIDLGDDSIVVPRAGLSLGDDAVEKLRGSFWRNHVLAASPELSVAARIGSAPVTLVGTWFDHPLAEAGGPWPAGLATLRPHWALSGRWPAEGAAEVVLGADLAAALAVDRGARVPLAIDGRDATDWLVTGVVSAGGPEDRLAFAPLGRVQQEAGLAGEIDRVWVSALVVPSPSRPAPSPDADPAGYERYMCTPYPENLVRDLASSVPGSEVAMMTEAVSGEAVVVGRLNLLMLLLALAALAASTLGLLSTATATVVERRVELGLLRAIGASPRQLAMLLLGETVLVGLAGGVAGWAAGTFAARAIRGEIFGPASGPAPMLLPVAIVLALAVSALGTAGPLRMALRLDPSVALRG